MIIYAQHAEDSLTQDIYLQPFLLPHPPVYLGVPPVYLGAPEKYTEFLCYVHSITQ